MQEDSTNFETAMPISFDETAAAEELLTEGNDDQIKSPLLLANRMNSRSNLFVSMTPQELEVKVSLKPSTSSDDLLLEDSINQKGTS